MASWQVTKLGTLKAFKADSGRDTVTFNGVNADVNVGGDPEKYLAAVNRLLAVVGESARLADMKLTTTQEANE